LLHRDAALGLVTALVTGIIFLLRGRNFRPVIWGDDQLLFEHAINRQLPFGRLRFIDPIGLLDPFAGSLVVILRIVTKALVFQNTGNFPLLAFWFSSLAWTVIAICIALVIGRFTRPYLGFLAAVTVAIMPFSNLVMLAQVNTIYMPAVLVIIITVVTRQYPQSRILQVITCMVFALVALTSITTVVVFVYLLWLVYIRAELVQVIERRLVWVIGGSLMLQALSYQPRGRNISPSRFIHEILLSSNAFAPQFVREKVLEPKSLVENIVLYGIPIVLGITVSILAHLGKQSERRAQVEIAKRLFLIALVLICLLIVGNGWLNSHYLFIPTGLFWIGVIFVSDAACRSKIRFRMIPVTVVLAVFLIQLSGTYFVI